MIADALGAADPDLEPEPEPEAPERSDSSTPEEKLKHALATLKLLAEMGEDKTQIEAEIAGIRGDIAGAADDPNGSLRLTAGQLEEIKRKVKEDQDREKAERAAQEKAGRASSRRRDDAVVWLWASGAPDGSDGNWKRFAQPTIDQLEGGWGKARRGRAEHPSAAVDD